MAGEVDQVQVPNVAAAVGMFEPAVRAELLGEPVHQKVGLGVERNGASHHGARGER
jgi:hypothetical protein